MVESEAYLPKHDPESEAWSAISAFETILEAFPDDRSSLETLSHAYEHIGDQTKTLEYLRRLAEVVLRDAAVPIVALSSFEIPAELYEVLPLEFMIRRGVIVYDYVGEEALVVVMNPYDTALRQQVEARLGRKCHFFISLPSEFDAAVERIKESGVS